MTGDPQELPELIETRRPRLVLLDLMRPGADGIELMERTPELTDLPVICLCHGREDMIGRALEAGAADYIVKPFSPTELTARVRAALRRSAGPEAPFVLGDLVIDYERRRVTVAARVVPLTAKEYGLLRALSVRAGRMATYDTLLREAWRDRRPGDDEGRVRAVVKQVRRKLGDDARRPVYIFTEHGVGYRMPEPGDGRAP